MTYQKVTFKQNLKVKISPILVLAILVFNITIIEGLPYNGIVIRSGNNIYVLGNDIDGELAALRKLVDDREFYFSKSVTEKIDYVSEEDLDGIFVFDYLHTDENQEVTINEV
ncbi:hypothetical protein HYX08_07295 [Candidatus Woesearchaeota archaeon]|nr:hypothetical protein [Candidatus Woesearchaeota archaeon]